MLDNLELAFQLSQLQIRRKPWITLAAFGLCTTTSLISSMDGDMEPKYDRRTVFVQGISFDLQQHQFEEAFSEIGPVRKSFLIGKKGEQRHKVLLSPVMSPSGSVRR